MEEKVKKIFKIPCEVYSRVVGYMRPLAQWNPGKQEEFRQRKTFNRSLLIKKEKKNGKD